MSKTATLTLRQAHRAGGEGKAERDYFDFYISGTRLLDLLGGGINPDAITPLGWEEVKTQERALAELLLGQAPSLPTGRCMLYVCAQCGDISCGAITVRIQREGEFIVWRDFGYEHDWEDDQHLSQFASVGPFYFEPAQYEQTLKSFRPRKEQ
jgi:hypothetical protein